MRPSKHDVAVPHIPHRAPPAVAEPADDGRSTLPHRRPTGSAGNAEESRFGSFHDLRGHEGQRKHFEGERVPLDDAPVPLGVAAEAPHRHADSFLRFRLSRGETRLERRDLRELRGHDELRHGHLRGASVEGRGVLRRVAAHLRALHRPPVHHLQLPDHLRVLRHLNFLRSAGDRHAAALVPLRLRDGLGGRDAAELSGKIKVRHGAKGVAVDQHN